MNICGFMWFRTSMCSGSLWGQDEKLYEFKNFALQFRTSVSDSNICLRKRSPNASEEVSMWKLFSCHCFSISLKIQKFTYCKKVYSLYKDLSQLWLLIILVPNPGTKAKKLYWILLNTWHWNLLNLEQIHKAVPKTTIQSGVSLGFTLS